MKTIIHVNQAVIRRNMKEGRNDPPIIVKTYKGSKLCHTVSGQSFRVMNGQLPCGAGVWIETDEPVEAT